MLPLLVKPTIKTTLIGLPSFAIEVTFEALRFFPLDNVDALTVSASQSIAIPPYSELGADRCLEKLLRSSLDRESEVVRAYCRTSYTGARSLLFLEGNLALANGSAAFVRILKSGGMERPIFAELCRTALASAHLAGAGVRRKVDGGAGAHG